jgi:hypothetical protein
MKNKKSFLILSALFATLFTINEARAACGGDGDGSSAYYCESKSGDIFVDGRSLTDGTSKIALFSKDRTRGIYDGTEMSEFALSFPAVLDFSKKTFFIEAAKDYSHIKIESIASSVKIICAGESAVFMAHLTYRLPGTLDQTINVKCSFGYSH